MKPAKIFIILLLGVVVAVPVWSVLATEEAKTTLPNEKPDISNPQTVGEAAGEMTDIPDQSDVHSDVPPPSREVFVDSACDFEDWIGKPLDEAVIKETGRPYRILKPDDMMTMDHNPERINIEHDGGKVVRVWCG